MLQKVNNRFKGGHTRKIIKVAKVLLIDILNDNENIKYIYIKKKMKEAIQKERKNAKVKRTTVLLIDI